MQAVVTVSPAQVPEVLLGLATVRPVFLWGPPGIGKSSLVREFAESLGLECVSLLGTQLAPEDLIGVPQIRDGRSVFCPPEAIARDEPYCLFLDELNAATPDVQKAFYSLILDRRIGNYELPAGSIVIGAGNRATDNALARPLASALVNRLTHVHLEASARDWLAWAGQSGIHPWVTDYLTDRPHHLWSKPPKTEEPFSTPRSWHMLSDAIRSFGPALDETTLKVLAHGTLSPTHASAFCGYVRIVRSEFGIDAILKGDARWPNRVQDRDLLYYLAESFRGRLVKELPASKEHASPSLRQTAYRAQALLVQLAEISVEVAQTVIADDEDGNAVLPAWFLLEAARDMPRLVEARR
ncbi:MoxR family ATPase [Streptomyces cocklensis]|uniref:AAA domain (Dynein-related subfamily) n=1 Tax=Actinacidiphila cocklensis TaxID=887465 RepID=A0A9W4E826_9ACTN|nr:MoxR family ATPase [Actinacidiphila cocklensis]MDD1057269.1 MoxR family ATPase [Actinacidiphila cocklensis]CAG6394973.1 AAA domain (Dynein-related subfamily) [Actinacidiphila cocklensis]